MSVASLDPVTGGPARSVPFLANALKHKINSQVKIFVSDKNHDGCSLIEDLNIDHIKNLTTDIKKLDTVRRAETIIHNHGIWHPMNHCASSVARKNNIPIIISPRGMLEPWARNYKKFKKTIAWYCYQRQDLRRASLVHATSQMEAENIQTYGLDLPIAVIPNGIDPPSDNFGVKKIKNEKKTALFLSRLHPKKGLINLVRAWHNEIPANWQVVIAGPDESDHKQEVISEINNFGLTNVFKFIGQVKDKDKWGLYKKADLFILPTLSENFGIVVLEALACGLPVITTKGAPWQDLERYKCGWWVEPDISALSNAISHAVSLSDDARYSMGVNGIKYVTEKYSWSKIAEEMGSVYSWVLNGGSTPSCITLPI